MWFALILSLTLVSESKTASAFTEFAALTNAMSCVEENAIRLATRTQESIEAIARLAPKLCAKEIEALTPDSAQRLLYMDSFGGKAELSATRCRLGDLSDARCQK